MKGVALAALFAVACVTGVRATAAAEWTPPDLRPSKASLAVVLPATLTAGSAAGGPAAQRHERWTYTVAGRHLPVRVAVKGDDFRATIDFGDGRTYAGGRVAGVRWRADANDIAHATLSDDQGDAADRLPQSVFPFARADCSLAGESTRFGAAWVVVDRPPRDKPHWFYIDKATSLIAHEITREGARTIVTSFDGFAPAGVTPRPRHWRVDDGDAANAIDVVVDAVVPENVDAADVAIPQAPRLFAPAAAPPNGVLELPATFRGRTIFVNVGIAGHPTSFVLDTGTASITLDRGMARRFGFEPLLEHATVPRLTVGPLVLNDASTLVIPFEWGTGVGGILGYDFFLGHVVHIDYARQRVEIMTADAAAPAFRDPHATVIDGYFDEGIPLVHAAFGAAAGDRFALDTGSPHLLVLAPFTQRYRAQIDALWSATTFGKRDGAAMDEVYLEGSIRVAARRAAMFSLAGSRFADVVVGTEVRNERPDAIDIPLDGIVGTDQLAFSEWWFDYDGGRIAVRRNDAR